MNDKRDLTTGSVWQKLMNFAMPIVGINLLQAVYNVVDMVIVGHICGSVGMSAVSIGGQITFFVLSICSGIANGGSIYMGQIFGAGKMKESKCIVGTLLGFLIILALALTGIIIGVKNQFLELLNTPDECFVETSRYLTICMAGTVFVYVNDGLNGVLRGVGESLNPMLFVFITTVENLFLDLLFVSAAVSAVFFAVCELFPGGMYSIFTSEDGVAEVGGTYLRLYAISFLDESVLFCMNGVLAGAGYTLVSMAGSVTAAFGIRYIAAYWFCRHTALGFAGIALGYSLAPIAGLAIAGGFLLSGRWKKSRIKLSA